MRILFLAMLLAAAPMAAAQTPANIPADYELGPGDTIRVTVLDEANLTIPEARIDADGTFEYPYLGRVDVRGKTKRELGEEIATKLKSMEVVNRPQVSVDVTAMRPRYFKVAGEVRNPNKYTLQPGMTLLDALFAAGGAAQGAGTRVILQRLNRSPDGKLASGISEREFNLNDILSLKQDTAVALEEDDAIAVLKAQHYYVSGQVKTTGEQTWEPGLTVRIALLRAGGISEKGSSRRVKIIRMIKGKQKKLDADDTTLVQPDDIIEVGQKLL